MVQSRIHGLLAVSILLWFSSLLGLAEGQTCREDYEELAHSLINTSSNRYQLSITFFPTNRAPPAFVKVTYRYDDANITDQTWLWSAGAFYFFQPLRIYQYTSLFFGNPELRISTVTLTLPAGCSNAQTPIMETLTQRLKLIASSQMPYPPITDTYQAKAASATTVHSFYYRENHEIIALIHAFQVLFPFVCIGLFLVCFAFWCSVYRKDSGPPNDKDWSTLAAYYGVCLYFTSFVLCLDCTALHYRLNGTEIFITGNEDLKNLVIFPFMFDLVAWLLIVALGFISSKCPCCTNSTNMTEYSKLACESLGGLGSNSKDVKYTKWQFRCLSLAGLAPFMCIASHAHFILIAWITAPAYASGIGVFYGISFFVYFITFKFLYHYLVSVRSCIPCIIDKFLGARAAAAHNGDARNGDAHNGDARNGDARNGDAPNGDTPNGNAPNGDPPNGEAHNNDAPNGDAPNGDTPNGDTPNGDAPNGDAPNSEAHNNDAPNGDAPNGDPPNSEAHNNDAPNGDAPNGDPPNGEAHNNDAPNGDAPNGDTPNGDTPNSDAHNNDAANGDARNGDANGSTEGTAFSYSSFLLTLFIGVFLTGFLAMIVCFFVLIPIDKSIEETPTQLYVIYQGIIVVYSALLTYIVIAKPGSFFITKGVKEALKKVENISEMTEDQWKMISDEQRLAEVITKALRVYIPRPSSSSSPSHK